MPKYTLENDTMHIEINSQGAELRSAFNKVTNREYMWQADPKFWGRTSPVLFPMIGKLNGGVCRLGDDEYQMPKHGFSRDREFSVTSKNDTSIWFSVTENEETLKMFPFPFELQIGYLLKDNTLDVVFLVRNEGMEDMYFNIGGHPAFNVPFHVGEKKENCFIEFKTNKKLTKALINIESGLVCGFDSPVGESTDGFLALKPGTFKDDAIVIDGGQINELAITDSQKNPIVNVSFESPVVGIWSPSDEAPFICIEPWWGCCDAEGYEGDWRERPYTNHVEAGGVWEDSYTIEFL